MPQTATRVPAARRRRLRRIVIFLVTALSLIGVSVTAASVGAGSPAVARWRAPDNRLPASSPSGDAHESLDFVQHSTLVPAPMPTPAPVLELTAAIVPIAPTGPGGPGSASGGGSVAGSGGGFAAAASGSVRHPHLPEPSLPADEWPGVGPAQGSGGFKRELAEPLEHGSGQQCRGSRKGARLRSDGRLEYRADVIANLKAAIGTEGGGALALAREAAAYALAADFIDLAQADPQFDPAPSGVAHSV